MHATAEIAEAPTVEQLDVEDAGHTDVWIEEEYRWVTGEYADMWGY